MSISYGFGLADGTTWIKPFLFLCLNMMYQTMDVSFPIQTIHKTPILSSITSGNGFSFPMHKRKYDKKRNQTIQIIGETVFFDSLFMFGVILSPSNYFHELIRKSNQKHILVPYTQIIKEKKVLPNLVWVNNAKPLELSSRCSQWICFFNSLAHITENQMNK